MRNEFNLDDLEGFLSETVESHKMYPSDRVWRNIDTELHGGKRKWPALTFACILTGAILMAGLLLVKPDKELFTVQLPAEVPTLDTVVTPPTNATFIAKVNGTSHVASHIHAPLYIPPSATGPSDPYAADALDNIPETGLAQDGTQQKNDWGLPDIAQAGVKRYLGFSQAENTLQAKSPTGPASLPGATTSDAPYEPLAWEAGLSVAEAGFADNDGTAFPGYEDSLIPALESWVQQALSEQTYTEGNADLSGQPVTALPRPKEKKWQLQYYVTPSISYRYLDEDKIINLHLPQGGPVAPYITNGVNNFVRHKAKLGMELGASTIYNITPNLSVRVGLQLNYRAYAIEAFANKTEASTLLLNRGVYTDSIITYSSISNSTGYYPLEMTNQYWQVSAPVGFDLKLLGKKKLGFFVAASVQPTYQFNKTAYILSNDYNHYTKRPELLRNWNINTALEAFIRYPISKKLNLQAGPQIRYQLMPGTIKEYPIKEHLLDMGFKVGILKTLQ